MGNSSYFEALGSFHGPEFRFFVSDPIFLMLWATGRRSGIVPRIANLEHFGDFNEMIRYPLTAADTGELRLVNDLLEIAVFGAAQDPREIAAGPMLVPGIIDTSNIISLGIDADRHEPQALDVSFVHELNRDAIMVAAAGYNCAHSGREQSCATVRLHKSKPIGGSVQNTASTRP